MSIKRVFKNILLLAVMAIVCWKGFADDEISLKEDRSAIEELRKEIPPEVQKENDDLKDIAEIDGPLKMRPEFYRRKFDNKMRKERADHRKEVRKSRENKSKDQRKAREEFKKQELEKKQLEDLKVLMEKLQSNISQREKNIQAYNEKINQIDLEKGEWDLQKSQMKELEAKIAQKEELAKGERLKWIKKKNEYRQEAIKWSKQASHSDKQYNELKALQD